MPAYAVTVRDTDAGGLQRITDALRPQALGTAIGEAGKIALINHFAFKESLAGSHDTASRLGARPSGLYAQFARATSWQVAGSAIVLSIEHPAVRQRLEGGVIKAADGGWLTIPAIAAAYARRAREFNLVPVVWTDAQGRERGMLISTSTTGVKKTRRLRTGKTEVYAAKQKVGVYFWLVRETAPQDPDPTVLPTDEALLAAVTQALDGYLGGLN